MEIVDLTAAPGPGTPSWPGTEAPRRGLVSSLDDGDPATVSPWTVGAHDGAPMGAVLISGWQDPQGGWR